MDAIDILGGLLGGGSRGRSSGGSSSGGGGGLGGRILEELLKGGGSRQQPSSPTQTSGRSAPSNRPINIDSESQSLEDLLGVATGKGSSSIDPSTSSPYRQPPAPPTYQPQPPTRPAPAPARPNPPQANQTMTTNDEAIVLIRALINAAKADGRIDNNEQQAILSQVPNDQETINFLRQEFAQPLDVREFAWSVPLGMEVKVYAMSLAGMQLDNNAEAQYLRELAHGLRLDPDLCNQIHAKYGAQPIFQ